MQAKVLATPPPKRPEVGEGETESPRKSARKSPPKQAYRGQDEGSTSEDEAGGEGEGDLQMSDAPLTQGVEFHR